MKVLLVDDNEINLEIQQMMIESCGLDTVTADNGKTAVELVAENDFFMVFMDIHMPEMDGYTACEKIREFNKDIPIIALSADVPRDDERFMESGMTGFLTKPLEMESLREMLRKYIEVEEEQTKSSSADDIFDFKGLINVMKDEKSALRLIRQFLSVHSKDCEILVEMTESGNFVGAREILHNVTGISGNMFCRKLYKISCTLRNELRNEKPQSLYEFAEIWNRTCDVLKKWHERLSEKYPSYEYETDWKTLWDNFISLSYAFDISAVDIFIENMQAFMANMSAENFKKLKKAVLHYDFLWISDNM